MEKFREIIGKIDAYLSDNAAKPNGLDIILTGDFNFPANIVEWIPSDNGLKPNRKSGTCDEKIAFGMLNDLANQFNMEQLVDRPTRGTATLDLVFSNIPELFSSCSTISLAKVSDHDLIHFSVENSNIHQLPSQNAANQPEITKFNFLRANVPRVTQSLESTNWNIINANTLENANKLFVDAITQAASISGVPKYPNAQPGLPRLQGEKQLISAKIKLDKKLANPRLRHTDRDRLTEEVGEVNKNILNLHIQEQARKENRIISQIKQNPKAFYKYANSKRKTKEKIGPLKPQGYTDFVKEPQEIAELLGLQYKSVFQPKCQDISHINFPLRNCPPISDVTLTREIESKPQKKSA